MNTNGEYRPKHQTGVRQCRGFAGDLFVLGLPVASWAAGKLSGDLQYLQAREHLWMSSSNSRILRRRPIIATIRQQGGILKKAFANVPVALCSPLPDPL